MMRWCWRRCGPPWTTRWPTATGVDAPNLASASSMDLRAAVWLVEAQGSSRMILPSALVMAR